MKTQIIQLEAHDDLVSTRDKMGASQAGRILLVWPHRVQLLHRKLDLVLLQRHSRSLGVQLGLVTQEEEVRFHAAQLGIPTFYTTRQAQVDRWRTSSRRPRKPARPKQKSSNLPRFIQSSQTHPPGWLEHPVFRLVVFSLSLAAVLVLASFILPGARITLKPGIHEQRLDLPVRTNPNLQNPTLAGELPVHWATVSVEGRDSIEASGTTLAPEKTAVGSVVFKNLTEKAVEIPAGTIVTTLATPVVRFFTLETTQVSAGIGNTVTTPVQAVVPGKVGNLPSNRLQAIEGTLGLSLTVNNPAPTQKGTDQPVASPTEADRKALFARLQNALEETARREIELMLLSDEAAADSQAPAQAEFISDYPLLSTLRLKQVLEETYLPPENQPASELTLRLRLEFEYQMISAAHLQELTASLLAVGIPAGFQPIPGTLWVEHIPGSEQSTKGVVQWQITVGQTIQNQITPEQASLMVRGLHINQARYRLENGLDLASEPSITIVPAWWPYLPYLPFRIEIDVQAES